MWKLYITNKEKGKVMREGKGKLKMKTWCKVDYALKMEAQEWR